MASSSGVTSACELERTLLEKEAILNMIDTTAGLFDFSDPGAVGKGLAKWVDMVNDGIHVILLVLSVRSRFSLEELATVECLRKLFGSKISDYMIVVFTGGDELEDCGRSLDDYLGSDCPEPLKEILEICGNRCVLFDNKTKDISKKHDQTIDLLVLINAVLDKNGGRPFKEELNEKEISELEKNFLDSYEEHLKTATAKIEAKLSEMMRKLEQQLVEEQDASEASLAKLRVESERVQRVKPSSASWMLYSVNHFH